MVYLTNFVSRDAKEKSAELLTAFHSFIHRRGFGISSFPFNLSNFVSEIYRTKVKWNASGDIQINTHISSPSFDNMH